MAPFHKLRRTLSEFWYCTNFDLREKFNDVKAIREEKHLHPIAEFQGAVKDQEKPSRVAIIAIYPTDPITFSILILLSALRTCGFWTLVVSTKHISEAQRQIIINNCNHFIEHSPSAVISVPTRWVYVG